MGTASEHCSFVLLADFDIDRGAQLTHQFPQPLGTDEGLLANLMLPDGAERQLEDWTIFFLNQTPFNTIAPVLALETPDVNVEDTAKTNGGELLYVLNLVRTKHDKTFRRGALVKAMAICTRHPFIQIFKPVLLMALDDYFTDPSQECLANLFDAVNAMDISMAPTLSRDEKLIMRVSERMDVFAEKFADLRRPTPQPHDGVNGAFMHSHNDSRSSFEKEKEIERARSRADSVKSHASGVGSGVDTSFALGGSAVLIGDESVLEAETQTLSTRGRKSIDANSVSSHGVHSRREEIMATPTPMADLRAISPKDTHFYSTTIAYKGHKIPIKMPLSTFPEEVGDYSLIQLIQTFANANITGPQHPHLHTSGTLTHPIILLFNALVTEKRIIFLGYQRPAGQISSYVLSACALGSGCGSVMRGFISRAFPYANLTNRDEWERIPGFIAGVTNPIFESAGSWDLLCDVGTGRMVVHRDIHNSWPSTNIPLPPGAGIMRTGTLKVEGSIASEEDIGRVPGQPINQGGRNEGKADLIDNVFMEDIVSAISLHFPEPLVRARFVDYVQRFVRLAARYEEDYLGKTKIGYSSTAFIHLGDGTSQLGSGLVFSDEASAVRELAFNANRIEGWRRTKMYEHFTEDFQTTLQTKPIQNFDVYHQIVRMRSAKNMSDMEAEAITRMFVENVQTYEQVVEFLAYLPPHLGGLLPATFGLFHQQEFIREWTVELLTVLRSFPIGVQFLQGLNHFHRYSYVRQAHARESRTQREQQHFLFPPGPNPNIMSRTPSNQSESSLGLG